jgi:molecular chaperone DnaK (HSP70)
MTAVGIDFGTTNCALALYGAGTVEVIPLDQAPAEWETLGLHRVLPSVLALGPDGEPRFGWRAKQQHHDRVDAVKRLFSQHEMVVVGDEELLVEEVGAMLFAHLRRAALAQGVDFSRAVVTVPANSRGLARYRTKLCAGLAGVEVAALINEPTAAAMAYGLGAGGDQTVLVVDWGGGTLDVTVLGLVDGVFMEHASKGIQRLGGIDFDRRLYEQVATEAGGDTEWDEFARSRFRLELERAKITLSSQDEVSLALPGGRRVVLSRDQLDRWMAPLVQRAAEPIQRCLRDLGLSTRSIDHLLLVGGTCMMPIVREFVTDLVGREPAPGVEPLTAVAKGAAVAAAILAGEHDSDFFVSTEHALGTVCVDALGKRTFSTLIPRNHKLPARGSDAFVRESEGDLAVRVRVIEGDPDKPLDDEDNVFLKAWDVSLIPGSDGSFDIAYEYDTNGILHVTVTDRVTGQLLLADDVSLVESLDRPEMERVSQRVAAILHAEPRPEPG